MDIVEQKLQEENTTILYPFSDNEDNIKVILFGKDTLSTRYEAGKEIADMVYRIGENKVPGEPETDFSIHYIHEYEDVKKWITENLNISYEEFVAEYEDYERTKEDENKRDQIITG